MIRAKRVIHKTSILHCDYCGGTHEFLGGFTDEEVRQVAARKKKWFREGEYDVCVNCHKDSEKMKPLTRIFK